MQLFYCRDEFCQQIGHVPYLVVDQHVAEVDAYEAAEDRRDGAEHSLGVKGRLTPHRGARRGGTGPGRVYTALLREEGEVMNKGEESSMCIRRLLVCHGG
jgi:hypothetical protein